MSRREFLAAVAAFMAAPREAQSNVDVTLTGYCPCAICCGSWARYGRTAARMIPVPGFTLASRQYPIGTVVMIDSRIYQVHDLGGPKVPGFDVFHHTHQEARRFGVQRRRVQIVHIPKTQEVAHQ
jgi:3D (Asp-Asp-Asp) domain-containing protein